MASQMSYFNFNQRSSPAEEDLEDFIKRKNQERSNGNSHQSSPDQFDTPVGKSQSQRTSPLRNSNISPVRPNQSESGFSASHLNYFTMTPNKQMSGDGKHGSAKKSFGDSDFLDFKENNNITPTRQVLSQVNSRKASPTNSKQRSLSSNNKQSNSNYASPFRTGNSSNAKDNILKENKSVYFSDDKGQLSASQVVGGGGSSMKKKAEQSITNNNPVPFASYALHSPQQLSENSNNSELQESPLKSLAPSFRLNIPSKENSRYKQVQSLPIHDSLSSLPRGKPPLGEQSYLSHAQYGIQSCNQSVVSSTSTRFHRGEGLTPQDLIAQQSKAAERRRYSLATSDQDFASLLSARAIDNIVAVSGRGDQGQLGIDFTKNPVDQIVRTCRRKREKFIDKIFLPSLASLVNSTKKHKKSEWANYEWKRLSELYRGNKVYLYNEISPLQLKSGLLQNYDFISALACLAENPSLIQELMPNQHYNEEGCYSIKFCKDGEWKFSFVDDYVPVIKEDRPGQFFSAAFLKSNQNTKVVEIWPQILEKAWAKVFHTYENTTFCQLHQILRDLTGAPCQAFSCNEANIWDILCDSIQEGNIVAASCPTNQAKNHDLFKRGINALYKPCVLDVLVVNGSDGDEKIIKLRSLFNGENEWDGEWAYDSDKWTQELIEELNLAELQKENIIFLSLREFTQIFSEIFVCRYYEGAIYSSISLRHVKNAHSICEFSIEQPNSVYFEVTQMDKLFLRGDPSYKYSTSRLVIARDEGDGQMTYIAGKVSSFKYNCLKVSLAEGRYKVFVVFDWVDKVYDFNLSAFAEEEISFERLRHKENASLFAQMFEQYITQCLPPTTIDQQISQIKKYQLNFEELALGVEVFTNSSEDQNGSISKKIVSMKNCKVLSHKQQGDFVNLNIAAGKFEVVLVGKNNLGEELEYKYEEKPVLV